MADDLFWLFTLKVQPGKFDAFKNLVADIVAASSKEPGTLAYQYAVSDDQGTVHIYERYRDSQAFVDHVEHTFGGYAERFLSLVSVESLVVYGAPNVQARKALDSFNATYMTLFDGFARG
ncbi:putative quinol monooxygenase [Janthinobacterium sp. HLX7-2]|uniref:putative quinol monooxygenase n=1 Tax=Janthinobacterium sp. HLX7-2 TaxID=1259331 RepID=UPI003F204415